LRTPAPERRAQSASRRSDRTAQLGLLGLAGFPAYWELKSGLTIVNRRRPQTDSMSRFGEWVWLISLADQFGNGRNDLSV